MAFRRLAALALAGVMVAGLTLSGLAASGYGPGTTTMIPKRSDSDRSDPNNRVYDASYFTGGSTDIRAVTGTIESQISNASEAFASGDSTATVVGNGKEVSASTLRKAIAESRSSYALLRLDNRDGRTVLSRAYIDKSTASRLSGSVNLEATPNATAVVDFFEKYYSNDIAAVSFEHQGSFGTTVHFALKVNLSKLNTDSLVFYGFDRRDNTYSRMNLPHQVDSKGFLHVWTSMGRDLVITDKPLQ